MRESQVGNCIKITRRSIYSRVIRDGEILDKHFTGIRFLQVNGLKLQNNSCCACAALFTALIFVYIENVDGTE